MSHIGGPQIGQSESIVYSEAQALSGNIRHGQGLNTLPNRVWCLLLLIQLRMHSASLCHSEFCKQVADGMHQGTKSPSNFGHELHDNKIQGGLDEHFTPTMLACQVAPFVMQTHVILHANFGLNPSS